MTRPRRSRTAERPVSEHASHPTYCHPHTDTFAALRVPNFRRYYAGQSVSLVGTWMQSVALGWLVLDLGHSDTVLAELVARFAAEQPNERWQLDITHVRLAFPKPPRNGSITNPERKRSTRCRLKLDTFRDYYNNVRPHRALRRRTPTLA